MLVFQNLLFGTVYVPCILCDLKNYRVPNQWILTGWLTGLLYQFNVGRFGGLSLWFVSVLAPVLILFPLYVFRMLGAGDIKLISVAFGIYGYSAGFHQLVYIGITGAAGALLHMLLKRQLLYRLAYFKNYVRAFYLGLTGSTEAPVKRVISSMKNIGKYYDRKRDGYDFVIHFTVFIGLGILLWEVGP